MTDLYLRARGMALERGHPGLVDSIEAFKEVVAKDPSFAPAYAGLGAAYAIESAQFPVDHPADELARMRAAAERAESSWTRSLRKRTRRWRSCLRGTDDGQRPSGSSVALSR